MSNNRPRVLIVDDDPIVAESIAEFLSESGYEAVWATSGEQALQTIDDAECAQIPSTGEPTQPQPFSVVVTDVVMPEMTGFELIRILRRDHPDMVPIVITGFGTIEGAVEAIRMGAIDYLTKPIVADELTVAVDKAVRQQKLLADNMILRRQLDQRYGLDNIIGTDPRMRRIYEVIEAVAPSKTTVLMCGESGTGKSMVARAIHRHSPRADRPFVEISCGSIPESLLESELFGHVKGAFTGAHANKAGKFLSAHTGTLFLDEINSASPGMQLKLLRVLQERTFEPVGSNEPREVDVRVILATNQPLEEMVAAGQFRQDLYYRINVVTIHLPPLRDRIGDIPVLAEHFREIKAAEARKQVTAFDHEAIASLRRYSFPGNVRELENIVERAVVLTKLTCIRPDDFPPNVLDNSSTSLLPAHLLSNGSSRLSESTYNGTPLHEALKEPEKQIILAALEANNWNRQQTADQLQINRTTLYKKIKQYELEQYASSG